MKKIILMGLFILTTFFLCAQKADEILNAKDALRIISFLSSDDMKGRKVSTPEIDRAAEFISEEFKKAGLQTLNNSSTYQQPFTLVQPKFISATAVLDGVSIDQKKIIAVTSQPQLNVDQNSGFEITVIKPGGSLMENALSYVNPGKNLIVMVDPSYSSGFSRLTSLKRSIVKSEISTIFILGNSIPQQFSIEIKHEIKELKAANVVGILPGKKLKNEFVIFSAHYDHVGSGYSPYAYPHDNTDTIYNGANDDASGVTALILLAKYFKALNNNERTIVFAAFTAEESGGLGSKYFSRTVEAASVKAMFNIEMIGTESKWGKNSAYITGFEKTDLGIILQKNLEGTGFTFYPDPYTEQKLFYRSDNATLAMMGVPAHTLSTSKMDGEPNYHRVSDQVETLDINNMAMIIKSIALSSTTIIDGKDTPTRVKAEE